MFDAPVAAAVADGAQDLRDGALAGVQIPAEVAMGQTHGAVGVGIAAGREAGAAGRALRGGGVGVEARALGRQPIEVGGLDRRHAVGLDETAGVVGGDDQDVRRHGALLPTSGLGSLASGGSDWCHNRRAKQMPAREFDASLHQHGQHVRRAGGAWNGSRRHWRGARPKLASWVEAHGGTLHEVYLTMGAFDVLMVMEFDSTQACAQAMLAMREQFGGVTQTIEVFPESQWGRDCRGRLSRDSALI